MCSGEKNLNGIKGDGRRPKKLKLISFPLGDLNYISMMVPRDGSYDSLLSLSQKAFFPKGINPVIGNLDGFF